MFKIDKKLKNKHMYYCYNLELAKYLRDVCKFPYICNALNPIDEKEFYLFIKSPALLKRVSDYEKYGISES